MFGSMLGVADPGHRPDRPPADARARTRSRRTAACSRRRTCADGCRRLRERGGKVVVVDPRRSRTAEVADEHHFIRPGTDAHLLIAHGARAVRRRARGRRAARAEHSTGSTRSSAGRGDFTPEPASAGLRHPGRRDPSAWRASSRRRRAAVVYAPHRHLHAGVRHARELARGRAQRADRQPRPRGRRDVHARRRGSGEHARRGRPRAAACAFGRWRSRVRGLPEVFGELPVVCLAEEIETPGEGQVRALITRRRQPGADRRRTAAGSSARSSRSTFMLCDRHLPERDDAPRRRGPARAVAAREVALRPRVHAVRDAQRGELLAAACSRTRDERHAAGVDHAAAPHRRARRARGRTPTSRRSTTSWPRPSAKRAAGSATRPRPGAGRAAPRARAGARPHAARRAVRPHARRSRGEPARRRPRADEAARPRGAADARRGRSSWRPSRSWPTSSGCEASLDRAPRTAAWC